MSPAALGLFAAIFLVACASPGPTIAALVARVVGRGPAGIAPYCLGLILGDLGWLTCAILGLVALAQVFAPVFLVIRYFGAAYLLFLAWKLWTAPASAPQAAALPAGDGARQFAGGLVLALGNPKTMLFYLAILPTVVPLAEVGWAGAAELGLVVAVTYGAVLSAYVLLAARLRRLITSSRAMRIVNRVTGGVMAGAGAAVALRS